MMSAQMGKLPSVLFPRSIGRSIDGCDAIDTKKDTMEAYKKGREKRVKPMFLRDAKHSNKVVAFSAINTDIPTPMILFLFLLERGNPLENDSD